MRLRELLNSLDLDSDKNTAQMEITGIKVDSRKVEPGDMFVALRGQSVDGHQFVGEALRRGAQAIVCEKKVLCPKEIAVLIVDDAQSALAKLCAAFYGHPSRSIKVAGITGTNGKTTVSYLLEKIIAEQGFISGIIGTICYKTSTNHYAAVNTTPQSDLLNSLLEEIVRTRAKYAIIEVSSHALAQRRVAEIEFSHAIFTNLSREHLDYHKTISAYFSSKLSLFERLSPKSWAIINYDDEYGRKILPKTKAQVITFGFGASAQVRLKSLRSDINGSRCLITTPRTEYDINTPLIGRHNIYNILAAISFAHCEGFDSDRVSLALKGFSGAPGRLERIECGQDFFVFVDYAHTDDALEKVLLSLKELAENRVIVVFGCGGDRDRGKRPRMGKVAAEHADLIVITSDNPRSEDPENIIKEILEGIDKKKTNCVVVPDRVKAIKEALGFARPKDIVLIAGKGHECVQIFSDKTVPFDDREAAREILRCSVSKK